MKAIFIAYNQAHTERMDYLLDRLGIRGYTKWETVQGRGSDTGEPRMGTHTWPEMNSSILCIVEDDQVTRILDNIRKLNAVNEEVGIRAFVWEVTGSV
jgi:nitrogen regulatory protein PII